MSIQFKNPFVESLEEKTRKYLLQGAKQSQEDAAAAAKAKALEEIKKETEAKVLKEKKKQYEILIQNVWPNKIATILKDYWVSENKIRKDKELKDKPKDLEQKLKENDQKCLYDQWQYLDNDIGKDIHEYYTICFKLNKETPAALENETKITVKTIGGNKFNELKKQAQDLAKTIQLGKLDTAKLAKIDLRAKFDVDEKLQKLAEIPLTIEDKIEEIKDILDTILGKFMFPAMNPEKPEFDPDIIMAQLEAVIQPALAAIGPLEAVGGNLPIIGDLIGIMTMLSSSSKSGKKLTKEEIKKLIGDKKPEIPQKVIDDVRTIKDDVLEACATIPMILINLIFAMIDTIVGLFKQIAGVIGVPEIPYPLSLVPQAIEAVPKLIPLIWKAPQMMYAMGKGVVKDKLAEAMAMSIPVPNIDMDMIESLDLDNINAELPSKIQKVEDGDAEKPSSESKPEKKKISYAEVVAETLEKVKDAGYDRTDITRVLKSYKQIHDDSQKSLNKYVAFSGESKYDNLIPTLETVVRTKATPEDFQSVANSVFAGAGEDGVKYDCIKKTKSVVGALYNKYESEVKKKEPNEELIIFDTIEP